LWWSDPEIYGFKPFQIYFVSLPGWFVAALLYVFVSGIIQRGRHDTLSFRRAAQVISWAAWIATLVPAGLYMAGWLDLDQTKLWTMVATVVWFVATPLWMGRKHGK